jgi:hypothetical protein
MFGIIQFVGVDYVPLIFFVKYNRLLAKVGKRIKNLFPLTFFFFHSSITKVFLQDF